MPRIIKWFRDLFNPEDFYAAQRPILRVTFLGGMTPFTVSRIGDRYGLRCTLYGYINSCIHALTFTACYVLSLLNDESVTRYFFSTEISTLGDILQVMIGLVALLLTFFLSIFLRNKLIDAYHSLALTDEHFKEIGVETNYKSTLYFNYLIVVVQLLVQVVYCALSIAILASSNVYPSISACLSFFLPFMMMSEIIVLFASLVNQSKHRFYLLNKILKSLTDISLQKKAKILNDKPSQSQVTKFQKPLGITSVFSNTNRYMPDVINRVASIQSELCDACNCVEEYFRVQMLAIVTIAFLVAVFDSYYVLETIFTVQAHDTPFTKMQFIIFFMYQAFAHVLGVLKIVYMSNRAMEENEKIAPNVHKLINVNNYDEEITNQLTNLSLQLTHRKVTFTAHGFFKLDFTLLFTLVGAATTYLVILVQFTLNQTGGCIPQPTNSTMTPQTRNISSQDFF